MAGVLSGPERAWLGLRFPPPLARALGKLLMAKMVDLAVNICCAVGRSG